MTKGGGEMRHKDGCTATCPYFRERVDYMSGHMIRCGIRRIRFRSRLLRDQHYQTMCCNAGFGCRLLQDMDKQVQE